MWCLCPRRLSFFAHTAIWRLHVMVSCVLSRPKGHLSRKLHWADHPFFILSHVRGSALARLPYIHILGLSYHACKDMHRYAGIRIATAKQSRPCGATSHHRSLLHERDEHQQKKQEKSKREDFNNHSHRTFDAIDRDSRCRLFPPPFSRH